MFWRTQKRRPDSPAKAQPSPTTAVPVWWAYSKPDQVMPTPPHEFRVRRKWLRRVSPEGPAQPGETTAAVPRPGQTNT